MIVNAKIYAMPGIKEKRNLNVVKEFGISPPPQLISTWIKSKKKPKHVNAFFRDSLNFKININYKFH